MYNCTKIFGVVFVGLLISGICESSSNNFQDIPWNFDVKKSASLHSETEQTKSTVKIFINNLYKIWSKYITPYDGPKCSFYPTCSTYAIQAINKHGIIRGEIVASDRITRCNWGAADKYKIKRFGETNRIYDPVK